MSQQPDAKPTPILTEKNQYFGINAHLNSQLQRRDWEEFHTNHISDIQGVLNRQLTGSGYYARLEKGLQIKYEGKTRHPESDVLIVDRDPLRYKQGAAPFPQRTDLKPYDITAVLTPADIDTDYFHAVTLYKADFPADKQPVAWIEFLSPSNKSGGSHYREYLEKRENLLDIGQCAYVEIDYLHQSSPTFRVPDYTEKEEAATPYRIAILDTRPNLLEEDSSHKLGIIGFSVDEKIPVIPIPLFDKDIVLLDLDKAYNNTFERIGYGAIPDFPVNYAESPLNFYTYTQADQARIQKRMQMVIDVAQKAAAAGMELDAYLQQVEVPIPVMNS